MLNEDVGRSVTVPLLSTGMLRRRGVAGPTAAATEPLDPDPDFTLESAT